MGNYHLDETDRKILYFLVNNARMPYLEIARECGISGAAVHQRVKKLEDNGVITGSQMLVKPGTLGLNVCAFISISLSEDNKYQEVSEALKHIPEVVECHFVTGKAALFVKLYCIDNDIWKVVRTSPSSAITWVASLLSGCSSSSKDGSFAKSPTQRSRTNTMANGAVSRIQNHLVIFRFVLSVILSLENTNLRTNLEKHLSFVLTL